MAIPAENPLSGILHDIKLLRDQVDEIQIQSVEKRKAWYRQPSLLFSIMALLVSTVTTVGTFVVQKRAKDLADLQQLTTDIVDINKQMFDVDPKDVARASTVNSLLNTKREIMLSRSMELTSRLGSAAPPELLQAIGFQEQQDGNAQAAEQLYLRALKHPSDNSVLMTTRRSLAILYMTPSTPVTNLDEGRRQFENVIKVFSGRKDDPSIYQRAFTYETWGGEEFVNDRVSEGKQAYARAEQEFRSLSATHPWRQSSLDGLPGYKIANFRLTTVARDLPAKLQGTWKGGDENFGYELNMHALSPGTLSCSLASLLHTVASLPLLQPLPNFGTIGLEDDTLADMTINLPNPPGAAPGTPAVNLRYKLRIIDPAHTIQMQPWGSATWITLTKS